MNLLKRLVNPSSDCYCKSKYPIVKEKTRGRFTFCWNCNKLYAKWIVVNSEYAVDDPTFLCERCFRNTHFEPIEDDDDPTEAPIDEDNQPTKPKYRKLFDFKAYHFSQL